MTDYSIASSDRQNFGSVVGRQAQAILRGPADITEPPTTELGFYGWGALAVEAQLAHNPTKVESRIVYVDLYAEDQGTAILRAVSFDWRETRTLFDSQGDDFRLMMPARFVWLSRDLVFLWLSAFYGINVPLKNDLENHDHSDIRKLRIVPDYKNSAFEKIWEIGDEYYRPLSQAWSHVWKQMTQVLETAPIAPAVEECYELVSVRPIYDLDSYHPQWFPLKNQVDNTRMKS